LKADSLPEELRSIWARANDAYVAAQWNNARALYQQVCNLAPSVADAWLRLGLSCERLGSPGEAAQAYRAAVDASPTYAEAHFNLGRVLQVLHRFQDAEAAYRRATELNPEFAAAYNNLGLLLAEQGRHSEAVVEYRKGLHARPSSAQIHYNLAVALELKRSVREAAAHYAQSLNLEPNRVPTLVNFAAIILDLGHAEEAERASRHAIRLEPFNARAHFNLAKALAAQGALDDAEIAYEQALRLDPEVSAHLANKAIVAGMTTEAISRRRRFQPVLAYAQFRIDRLQRCDWADLAALRSWLADLIRTRSEAGESPPAQPMAVMCLGLDPELLSTLTKQVARDYEGCRLRLPRPFRYSSRGGRAGSRIRIGYVSADFRSHNHFHRIHNLFEKHDHGRFEVFAYSLRAGDDSRFRERAEGTADHFRDIAGQAGLRAARQIHADGVQILVDLNGYTSGARPDIFALRPAPIQVHYPIGFPGTLSADFIDYLIADRVLVPPDMVPFYSENLVFLPEGYQGNDYIRPVSDEPLRRADFNLPDKGFVFCCFTDSEKIEPGIFDIWMDILRETPGSVLWLRAKSPEVRENLGREASARGVDPSRLVYIEQIPKERHLARQTLADLFLDTPIFNAHTTAVDALSVGLPVLTCPGRTLGSRVAASLLTSAGLPDLIATSLGDYKARAIEFATDRPAYLAIRLRAEAARLDSPLFDTSRLVKHLEHAYRTMWARYTAGEAPSSFEVPVLTERHRSLPAHGSKAPKHGPPVNPGA